MKMMPRFPVFIPSKGRWQYCTTMKAMEKIGVPYKAVVEPQEYDLYAAQLGEKNLMVLPFLRLRAWRCLDVGAAAALGDCDL